jgi:hypothetical protein
MGKSFISRGYLAFVGPSGRLATELASKEKPSKTQLRFFVTQEL